ncbi:DcaP family trimeric outer membrane transporter [Aureibacter tunicatorum]|uniref:Uncharacterized protein n=1 Tax=Aureibacter tunicatorum TaxID=866807 RepID=A0AAE3XMK7_9BACT|nr:DcaP family trimeric outer membrane transporter [Aureibacter tunicatorum]MDR6238680.1 hypothetical protein [Aureibacter tunicatorum]BDD05389.1 hypothetical protein AUTU_28720 [Aureibacter tunicatorum]
MGLKHFFIFIISLAPWVAYSQGVSDSTLIKLLPKNDTLTGRFAVSPNQHQLEPLDIPRDRGLYILTSDKTMQMRILGSVRLLTLYDDRLLANKNAFITAQIPVSKSERNIPNYNSTLSQTRLGFEVTRKTVKGDVFIRLETDFAGQNGFRIRHAYGSFGRLLIGQTWSLFTNVTAVPATVDFNGPTGVAMTRTPQVRYEFPLTKDLAIYAALEYSIEDYQEEDSSNLILVNLTPDFTMKIEKKFDFGNIQLSFLATTLTAKDTMNNLFTRLVTGFGVFGTVKLSKQTKIDYQMAGGRAVAHYIAALSGNSQDIIYDPSSGRFQPIYSYGGFVAVTHNWTNEFFSTASIGATGVENFSFQPENSYRNGIGVTVDFFWNVIEGSKVGLEYVYGKRFNKNLAFGNASRVAALFYYDF